MNEIENEEYTYPIKENKIIENIETDVVESQKMKEIVFANKKINNTEIISRIYNLKDTEQRIVEIFLDNPFLTYEEVGNKIGVTKGRVSQVRNTQYIRDLLNDIKFESMKDIEADVMLLAPQKLMQMLNSQSEKIVLQALKICFPTGIKISNNNKGNVSTYVSEGDKNINALQNVKGF